MPSCRAANRTIVSNSALVSMYMWKMFHQFHRNRLFPLHFLLRRRLALARSCILFSPFDLHHLLHFSASFFFLVSISDAPLSLSRNFLINNKNTIGAPSLLITFKMYLGIRPCLPCGLPDEWLFFLYVLFCFFLFPFPFVLFFLASS